MSPAVCAGRKSCKPGGCPADQLCYSFEDPFDEVSYCIPVGVCGAVPDAATRARWEQQSAARAAATLTRFQSMRDHRSGKVTQPAPQPMTQPLAPAASAPAATTP